MAERFKAPVLKTGVAQVTVGSNPTPSAILVFVHTGDIGNRLYRRHGLQPLAEGGLEAQPLCVRQAQEIASLTAASHQRRRATSAPDALVV